MLKTEPQTYSFDNLLNEGECVWDGVTNNLALKNIRAMKAGDRCLIYHSGSEKAVVGEAVVARDPYPDPKKHDGKLVVVNLKPVSKLRNPVSLAILKRRKELRDFDLIRLPRLSVMSLSAEVWKLIFEMSKEE